MSKSSKQKTTKGHQEQQKQMQHYLYADMDFINSFLAQSGKGLHLTSRHTNSNTDTDTEKRGSYLVDASGISSKKSQPTLDIGFMGNGLGLGGDEKSNAEAAITAELLERGENAMVYSEQAIEVALHDYAINLFIETIKEKIKEASKSNYFISSDSEWNILDYSFTLSKKLDAYTELLNSGFFPDKELAKELDTITPQAQALLKVMNLSLPSPYGIRKANRIGYLDEKSAKEFCNFIKIKGLSKNDAFEVEAVVFGNPKGNKWHVKLNMPSKMQKFRYKIY